MIPKSKAEVPAWFYQIRDDWQAFEEFKTIKGVTKRTAQLRRLHAFAQVEIVSRTYGPNRHRVYARTAQGDE